MTHVAGLFLRIDIVDLLSFHFSLSRLYVGDLKVISVEIISLLYLQNRK